MRDPYGLEMSGLPPEMYGDVRALRNRERIAAELLAQGSAPLGGARQAGRVVVAPSWAEGLAKLAQTFVGSRNMADTERGYRGIGDRYAELVSEAVREYERRKYGAPASTETIIDEQAAGGEGAPATITAPGVPGDPRRAAIESMSSPYAPVRRIAQMDLMQLNRQEDRKDTQAFRAGETAEARAARKAEFDARQAEAQRAEKVRIEEARRAQEQAARDREAMLRTAASLRPAPQQPQPRMIETPTGPMQVDASGKATSIVGPDGKPLGPKKAGAPLSATAQKELFEADDVANSAQNAIGILKSIITPDQKTGKSQNELAYEGGTAEARRIGMSFVPGSYEGENAAVDLKNKVTGQALENLKAIFGGMPTEGERKILLEMQGSLNQKAEQRKAIFERAIALAERRQQVARDKAKALREGTYFGAGVATNQDGGNVLDQADAILRGMSGNR